MPKLKTKSACKRRFKITGTGKVKTKRANKRHCMSKRTKRQIRTNRKAGYMFEGDAKFVKKIFLKLTRKKKKKNKKEK